MENRIAPRRPVVADDHLTAEEPPHQGRKVLHLRRRDAIDPVGVLHRGDAAAEAEGESPIGQALHGQCESSRDHGVAGVVVGGRGDQPDALAGRARSAAEDGSFLLVVALGDERCPESERLGVFDLSDDVPCALRLSGEQVAGQLVKYLHGWIDAHGAS